MTKRLLIIVCSLLIIALGWMGYQRLQFGGLDIPAPYERGLTWQECLLSEPDYMNHLTWEPAQDCFGHSIPFERNDEDRQHQATSIGEVGLQLAVGHDIYRSDVSKGTFPLQKYTLYKNGTPVASLDGQSGAIPANISLQSIGNRVAWEYMGYESLPGDEIATIIYDGQDVRDMYGVDAAYRPYGLAGKLIFVGKKESKYLIIYDGVRVGPAFDEITVALCCGPAFFSVQSRQGKYLFWGTRDGQSYVVEVSARS